MGSKKFSTLRELLNEMEDADYYWKVGFFALSIGAITHFYFIFLFAFLNVWELSFINIISVALYLYAIFGLLPDSLRCRRSKNQGKDAHIGWIVFIELLIHNTFATYLIGKDAGFYYYIYVFIGLPFFVDAYSKKLYFSQKFVAIGTVFFILFCECFTQNKTDISQSIIVMLHNINLFLFLTITSILSYAYASKSQEQQQKLEKENDRDTLTNLFNRRHFLQNHLTSSSVPFAVVILDLDRFKKVNDTYGHLCGDKVLQHISDIIRNTIDTTATAYRWGGEEFLLIFDNTDDIVKIKKTVSDISKYIANKTIVCDTTAFVGTTVTAGIAYDTLRKSNFDTLLAEADKALYNGKRNGRNCIVTKKIDEVA